MGSSSKPSWTKSQNTHIWLFNVNRGLCIFIRTPLNYGIMYDCGKSDKFDPLEDFLKVQILPYLKQYQHPKVNTCQGSRWHTEIAQLILSHPHTDHIAGITRFVNPQYPFKVGLITCPNTKGEPAENFDWNRITNQNPGDSLLNDYKCLYDNKNRLLPLQTIIPNEKFYNAETEYAIHYLRPSTVSSLYPENDQEYSNGLSFILWYRHGNQTILLPGDINPDALTSIMNDDNGTEKRHTQFHAADNTSWNHKTCDQPHLKNLLNKYGLSILVAPHHGLRSGYSQELYNNISGDKPKLVAISDSRKHSENHGDVAPQYSSETGASGLLVNIEGKKESRYSISTKNGHHMLMVFNGNGNPAVYLEKDPKNLLKKI